MDSSWYWPVMFTTAGYLTFIMASGFKKASGRRADRKELEGN